MYESISCPVNVLHNFVRCIAISISPNDYVHEEDETNLCVVADMGLKPARQPIPDRGKRLTVLVKYVSCNPTIQPSNNQTQTSQHIP
jgi:hypothetical protein